MSILTFQTVSRFPAPKPWRIGYLEYQDRRLQSYEKTSKVLYVSLHPQRC
jgi:hypothetical protein